MTDLSCARAAVLVLAVVGLSGCFVIVPIPLPRQDVPVVVASQPVGAPPAAAACPPASGAAAAEATVLSGLAEERRRRGLQPVAGSDVLRRVAQGHACDNAARGANGHVGSDGSDLRLRLARGPYRHGIAAENTGRGFTGPAQALSVWLASPRHAANLLHPAVREAGLGVAAGRDGRLYWVIVLAEPR